MGAQDAGEFCEAILAEDVSVIADIGKKHGINSKMEVVGIRRLSLQKGLAVLPLHLAASRRRVRSLECLLSAGADPALRDEQGRTALHLVVIHWPYVLTEAPLSQSRFHAAMSSMQQRAEACLSALCHHGVDVNAQVENGSGQTSMHLAVRYAALSAVHILAGHGGAVDAVDESGMTPLHMAAGVLNREITASLIRLGADVNKAVTQSGNRPLHLAALATACRPSTTPGPRVSCMTELLNAGAEPDAVNKAGQTALHEACGKGEEAAVLLLLRYGADVARRTPAGENCLFLFLDRRPNVRHASLLARLLRLASPLSVRDAAGRLPATLLLPQFSRQRDQLLGLARQPRRLEDACKIRALRCCRGGGGEDDALRGLLPERLRRAVLGFWDAPCDVAFAEEEGGEGGAGAATPPEGRAENRPAAMEPADAPLTAGGGRREEQR